MEHTQVIDNVIKIIKSKIEIHNEYEKEYDKQLAFNFNLFNFFSPGENKVSEILGYFLNPKESHGQADLFLNSFVRQFTGEALEIIKPEIYCEKAITNHRRIDLLLKLGTKYIAIENKIWANDQNNQLQDYSNYLKKVSNENYILLYLTPYGTKPTVNSISSESLQILVQNQKLKIISYKNDIFKLYDNWIILCESEKVRHFIIQFKTYLKIKFFGNKTMNITNALKEVIYNNETEIEVLLFAYKEIEHNTQRKHEQISKLLQTEYTNDNLEINIEKVGPFPHEGMRVYRYDISFGNEKICLQLVKDKVHLKINYFFAATTTIEFKEFAKLYNLPKYTLERKYSNEECFSDFIINTENIKQIFLKYNHLKV